MSDISPVNLQCVAAARVLGVSSEVVQPSYEKQRGFKGSIANGLAGVYVLTLGSPIAEEDSILEVGCAQAQPAAGSELAVRWLTSTTIEVTHSVGGALANVDVFCVKVSRLL